LLKRQSPTTVLFRTTLTQTITLYELEMLVFSTSEITGHKCVTKSNTERSWNGYLTNMLLQGTWGDALIV
jgi:hypothetical protein